MDLQSLYYFLELSKDLHMTRTANRLYISQQTLSNHILRLEEQLGVQLLYRKPTLSLTCAGEFVLAFAQVVNKEYVNLKDILSDIENQECGVLNFGASPMRMNTCLPHILPSFSRRYPNVELRLTDTISANLEPMVLDGKLDFAVVLSGDPHTKLVDHHLLNDQVYLCVSDQLLKLHYGDEAEEMKEKGLQGINVADFAKLPVCLHTNRLGYKLIECFDEGGAKPNTYLTSSDTRITTTVCFQGIAACFATQMRLINRQGDIPDNINIFPVYYREEPLAQRLSLVRRKDRYLSHYAKYFLELLFQYFDDVEHIRMERKASRSLCNINKQKDCGLGL